MAAADFFAFFLPETEAELLGEAANLPKTPTIQRGLEEDGVIAYITYIWSGWLFFNDLTNPLSTRVRYSSDKLTTT